MTIKEQLAQCSSKERKLLLKSLRKHIEEERKKYPQNSFTEIPIPEKIQKDKKVIKALRTRDYLVQITEDNGYTRLSVSCVQVKDTGDWMDGITWDTLFWIKKELGFGDYEAVEVYPKDQDLVNVANIRHLFILKEPLPFIWRKKT